MKWARHDFGFFMLTDGTTMNRLLRRTLQGSIILFNSIKPQQTQSKVKCQPAKLQQRVMSCDKCFVFTEGYIEIVTRLRKCHLIYGFEHGAPTEPAILAKLFAWDGIRTVLSIHLSAMKDPISFDNTEIAFAPKTAKELQGAQFLFSMMGKPLLVKLGTRLAPWSIKVGLPVKGLIRKTIFKQFVGGETLEEIIPVAKTLGEYNVQVILDYGVEGAEGETAYDHARDEFIRVIQFAGTQPNVPFMSVKVTGFARFSLLEKLDSLMHDAPEDSLIKKYNRAILLLTADEVNEWQRVQERFRKICEAATASNVGVLVDAEETWIQDPVDAVTMLMMDEYNKVKILLYNTIQLYRHDRLDFLKKSYEAALERDFILGAKLVRGAYMEKERKRAAEKNYLSPIQPTKESSDKDYNEAVRFCIDHLENIGLIVASHNENSNLLATQLLQERGYALDHPHVHFSQLYGMSDNITFNLAKAGCSVSKYLPFGPIKDVVPYLMRRAQENTSVGGQTGRELGLIKKELKRRKV